MGGLKIGCRVSGGVFFWSFHAALFFLLFLPFLPVFFRGTGRVMGGLILFSLRGHRARQAFDCAPANEI